MMTLKVPVDPYSSSIPCLTSSTVIAEFASMERFLFLFFELVVVLVYKSSSASSSDSGSSFKLFYRSNRPGTTLCRYESPRMLVSSSSTLALLTFCCPINSAYSDSFLSLGFIGSFSSTSSEFFSLFPADSAESICAGCSRLFCKSWPDRLCAENEV